MTMLRLFRLLPAALLLAVFMAPAHAAPAYKYFRIGSAQDAVTKPQPGFALMGGGTDLDEAFRFLCQRANGGDFLILRATGDDDYNPYVQPLCKLNSVATLILPNREAANDPFVGAAIAHAEAIFIAGGDQANYTRNWTNTPVQHEMNAAIARGVPLGGTSAGLAVMGEWAFSAEGDKPDDPNLDGKTALMNPLGPRITVAHGFLNIPALKSIITDTHFAKRNRMGRLLVFLAQIHATDPAHPIRGLGIEEKAAILLEPDGHGTVVGHGSAYLVSIIASPRTLEDGKQLPDSSFRVQKVETGKKVNLADWESNATPYVLAVHDGKLIRTPDAASIY
jgi:cyanophycinase